MLFFAGAGVDAGVVEAGVGVEVGLDVAVAVEVGAGGRRWNRR